MPRALSNDLRIRVVNACLSGELSARAAGQKFCVGMSTAIRWVAEARNGQFIPAQQGRPRGSRLDEHAEFIFSMLENKNDMTLDEMQAHLLEERNLKICRSGLGAWLQANGWSFKKKQYTPANKNALMSCSNVKNGKNSSP